MTASDDMARVRPTPQGVVPVRPPIETTGQKVRRLQAEARSLAAEHVGDLLGEARALAKIAEDIAGGGEAYPPGVRDAARQLVEALTASAHTIDSILQRSTP